ncbi:class A beta-lactamase [Serratia sp. UGAL515B_01]|uniref:class A beta-lactamase n=1 Tax=Serratia sp. UGAL515B_01 TaxID=2986763 RepID=UPI002952ACBC|nr:class A beta-lactamase [Serratia sp. UGAL515B_01]WON78728.1 class A beta-lactamase [Serratia sp. UGAL515B_01]
MSFSPLRRKILLAAAAIPAFAALNPLLTFAADDKLALAQQKLANLEKDSGGRLGVYAYNTANGQKVQLNGEKRFPFCSTFKVIAAGAILRHSLSHQGFLDQRIHYKKSDLAAYSPISEKHLDSGMTVSELCAAALQYSDNTSINLLMALIGGPAAVTAYARSIGDTTFRLDRWETELNSAIPGDERDTTSPAAMAASLQKLTLGDALPNEQRQLLNSWMKGNTTGDQRIRAGVPSGAIVADKTGSGDYGTANDIGVVWIKDSAPLVIAIYSTYAQQDAKARNDVIASATRIVTQALA